MSLHLADKLQIKLSALRDKEKIIRLLESATVYEQTDDGGILPIYVLISPNITVPLQN